MDSIIEQLKKEILDFKAEIAEEKIGTVIKSQDGIVAAVGLADVKYSEMVEFDNRELGVALNLEEGQVGIMVLGEFAGIKEGMKVNRQVPVPVIFDEGGPVGIRTKFPFFTSRRVSPMIQLLTNFGWPQACAATSK